MHIGKLAIGGWGGLLRLVDGGGKSIAENRCDKIIQLANNDDFIFALQPHELLCADINTLSAIQRIPLKHAAFNMVISDNDSSSVIIQSIDNQLICYEAASGILGWKVQLDNQALLPGPMACHRQSLILANHYELECYRIDSLATNKTNASCSCVHLYLLTYMLLRQLGNLSLESLC